MITMSYLPRLLNCPASAVLPRAETAAGEYATAGTEEHENLSKQLLSKTLPDELSHLVPDNARSEVKVAYDVVNRTGRIIGELGRRDYGELGPFEIAGQIDVLGTDGDTVVVRDFKTGHSDVEPADANGQLWGYAVAAAAALGKSKADIGIIYTQTGHHDQYRADGLELAAFADKLEKLHHKVAFLTRLKNSGETLPTYEGSWCRYCSSKPFCPSKNALLNQFAAGGLAVIGESAMTPDRARQAYEQFVRIESLVRDAKKRLEVYVDENGPIDLGNGRMYGRQTRRGNERLDGWKAVEAIRDVVGESAEEFVSVAIEMSTSKAAIKRAADQLGGGGTKVANAVVSRIRELGGASHERDSRPLKEYNAEKIEDSEVERCLTLVK